MSISFRQIHLDFHTSEHIDGVGSRWDPKHWQATLHAGRVDSVNVFATCHHGWSYFDTQVGVRHPKLTSGLDLTRAMIDASHEIGVRTQVYLTVGVNNRVAAEHPEWRAINGQGAYYGWVQRPTDPGFQMLCFNTPYLDTVCAAIKELATRFSDSDGLWLDIIDKPLCCCPFCLKSMVTMGLDPVRYDDRVRHADHVVQNYYQRTLAALRSCHATMRLTQNSGHIVRGDRRFFSHVTHLELESLPTWGWGYDDFPMTAKYAGLSGLETLGMTGKFHTYWGEFGGFKHPNALRYECAAMLAYGSKCSVGDQLHPDGRLDESTYKIIGKAYAEVERKEAWCRDTRNVADVGLLSAVALDPAHKIGHDADIGASRMLLEGHILFDVIDAETPFSLYTAIVIPDEARMTESLKLKLEEYTSGGGRILFAGRSPLGTNGQPDFALGCCVAKEGEFSLDYILPVPDLCPEFARTPAVMYSRYPRVRVTTGRSLGDVFEPYFERNWMHFCSHQHAPPRREPSGYVCGVQAGHLMWLPMDICLAYRKYGAVTTREYFIKCVRALLEQDMRLRTNLPSTGRVTLRETGDQQRYVLHLLHANLIQRGGLQQTHLGPMMMEIIEDLLPCRDVFVSLKPGREVRTLRLVPQGKAIAFDTVGERIEFTLNEFECHQMIELC